MPICPKCKYEYRSDQTVCPDCNEKLVDTLPPKLVAQSPDDSWVSVCRVGSSVKSEMAKGALDSSNIPSIVMSSSFAAHGKGLDYVSGLAQPQAGGNIIMVPREYREEAQLILEAILGDDYSGIQANNQ